MTKIKFKKLYSDVVVPSYKNPGDSGVDVCAYLKEGSVILYENSRHLIKTGLKVEIPEGFEIQVRPRSGMALNKGVTVLNTPGTVDSGYRGEIGVILYCTSPVKIEHGDRIAQLVLCPVEKMDIEVVEELSETERGSGGFGSTGIK